MKRLSLFTILGLVSMLSACGSSSGGPVRINGPDLSADQVPSVLVDQFFANDDLNNKYLKEGRFSAYLRDADADEDIACASPESGMKRITIPGVYYGNLGIPLSVTEGEHSRKAINFKVIFVQKNASDCPKPIDTTDDIIGESTATVDFAKLLGVPIWATNGKAMVVFRDATVEKFVDIPQMSPSFTDGLVIDKLKLGDNGEKNTYYIFADYADESERCQIDESLTGNINYGGMEYSAIGLPIPCLLSNVPNFETKTATISVQMASKPGGEAQLVAETAPQTVAELIGKKVDFATGAGYISFGDIETRPLYSPVVRLGDLTNLEATALEYVLTPSASPNIELVFSSETYGYTIACAGADQGLTGVGAKGSYTGLSAEFVAMEGQKELFGWDKVALKLIDRKDGFKCPQTLVSEPSVLAVSEGLSAGDLATGTVTFKNGAGTAKLAVSPK